MGLSPISRHEENNLQEFTSHDEAARYFKELYGSDFVFEEFSGEYYFYALVFNHAVYRNGRTELSKGYSLSGNLAMDFLKSYQSIQINKNGNVHIVH